jgi:hypothetical protein
MTEWKWEDAASRSPSCSVENPQENIASTSVEYIKAEPSHSHTRIFADGLEIQTENRAPTLAPSSRRGNGVPGSERCAKVMREKTPWFAPDTPGFLPLCECASVDSDFLKKAARRPRGK